MQYFTSVPYGFICQIKRRKKNKDEENNVMEGKIAAIYNMIENWEKK